MKSKPSMVVLRSLLFVFDIENTKNAAREEIITSKDVNNDQELAELFDLLLESAFLKYRPDERRWFIGAIMYLLDAGDNFDEVFSKMDTYFDSEVEDQRRFMKVLLDRLKYYHSRSV